MTLFLNQ